MNVRYITIQVTVAFLVTIINFVSFEDLAMIKVKV